MSMRPDARARTTVRQGGAALLLLLIVVGIGAGALVINAFGKSHAQSGRERDTLMAMGQAKDALVGFALVYGRLPRPAISSTNGAENPAPCSSVESCTGFIPWVTLGVGKADSWDKLLRYSVTPAYTNAPVQRVAAVPTKTVLTRDSTGRIIYLAGNPSCSLSTPCAPAVVYSSGRDNFGTSGTGRPMANGSSTNIDERANDVASLNFMSRAQAQDPASAGGEFDDLLTWVPIDQLYKGMNAAKVLP